MVKTDKETGHGGSKLGLTKNFLLDPEALSFSCDLLTYYHKCIQEALPKPPPILSPPATGPCTPTAAAPLSGRSIVIPTPPIPDTPEACMDAINFSMAPPPPEDGDGMSLEASPTVGAAWSRPTHAHMHTRASRGHDGPVISLRRA